MNINNIRDMYAYNYWANNRLLAKAEQVTQQFTAEIIPGVGSLQAALIHTLDAESSWRHFFQGQGFQPDLDQVDFPTVAALRLRWQDEERAMWAYLDSLSEENLTGILRYEVEGGVCRERLLWHCLYHVVNHGTQHRSEVAALLTACGHSPGEMDFTLFLNERGAKQ
jgi:uncharacterized damage-inducible protein DinB